MNGIEKTEVCLLMKKRIWYLIVITVILGGLVMKNLFATTEASSRKQEQDRIVNYIKQHVELTNGEPVNQIEFVEFEKNQMTGSWLLTSKINNKFFISFKIDEFGGEIRTSNYKANEFNVNSEKQNIKSNNKPEVSYVEDN